MFTNLLLNMIHVQAKHPEISYADLYTLAGVVAVEESGGPKIPFRLGRTDADSGETSPKVCRLPDADKGSSKNTIQHVRDVFYGEFMYFFCITIC